jgi:PKD repeat protein
VYTPESWNWDPIDMTMRYTVRGYYSNFTLTDAPGQAMFDTSTNEFVRFMFDIPIDPALPGDFGATLDVVTTVFYFEPWSPGWPAGLMDTVVGTLDVSGMTWTPDYTVPSGNYRTCFGAGDWGQNYIVNTTDMTVDNDPPFADAGLDQYVVVNTSFTVDGSASTDNVGIIEYYWQFTDEDGDLIEFYTDSFSYTLTVVGDYSVHLVVWDGGLNVGSDDVVIHVVEDMPPVANAGPDMAVAEDAAAFFDGSGSTDDVGIDNYTWTIVDLSVEKYEVAPNYTFADVGTYTVELNVTDTIGQWDTDTMIVTVTDATPPVADAGSDTTVDLGSSVTFDGSASSDNVGVISWTWTFFDGSDQTLTGDVVAYVFTTLGDHTVTLEVADAAGLTATDTVVITIVDGTPPTAAAGSDQTVGLGAAATLDGSGSSDNVAVVSWTWTFTDGSPQTLTGESVSYTFTTLGAHTVTLEVADEAGFTDTDTVVFTVVDDTPPTAVAGPDQTVPMGTLVDFDGSGSSDNVGIVSYTWTFNDGGAVTRTGVSPSYTFDNAGVFIVTLTVEDAAGLTDTDTMTVTVEDTESPVASAGADQYVLTGDAVDFNGSGSTDNVGVTNYTWTFTAGVAVTRYGVAPQYVFSAEGDITVTLTVRDAAGNSDTDTVVMHVTLANEGPTANAGADQTVDAGDTVTFDGSGSTDDAGSQNLNYTWHIEGTSIYLYGLYPEHVFDEPGTYVVNLTVTDGGDLTDTDSVTIIVQEKAKSFVESYWWLLVVVAVVVVGAVIVLMMKRGAGGSLKSSEDKDEEAEESVEDEAPPEDEEL